MSSLEDGQADMLATRVVMTNLVLLAPLLVLARRRHLPAGTATICYGAAALISATLGDFADLTVPLTIVAAGVGVDVLARVLAPTGDRRIALWGFAAAAGLSTWALYVGVAVVLVGVPAVAELWTGLPVITALVGCCWRYSCCRTPSRGRGRGTRLPCRPSGRRRRPVRVGVCPL